MKEVVWEKAEDMGASICQAAGKGRGQAIWSQEYVRRQMTREAYILCGGQYNKAGKPGGPSEVKVPHGIPVPSSDGVTVLWPRDA